MPIHVPHEVLDKTTTADLGLRLDALYMTMSLTNKIHLRKRLYTFFMAEGTPIQNHFDEFNSIIYDLKSLDIKIEDEDKAILLFSHYRPLISTSRKFYDIVIITLCHLRMSRPICCPKKNLTFCSEKGKGLSVKGESFAKGNASKSKFERHKSNKSCLYCIKAGM